MNKVIAPGYYELYREWLRQEPKRVEGQSNSSVWYYRHRLLNRILSVLEFDGFPETWSASFILPVLFLNGFFGVTDCSAGLVSLNCGAAGYNMYYEPTKLIFANPVLTDLGTREIGKDCEIVRLQPKLIGLWHLIDRYAELLSSFDASINVNLMNSRPAFIGEASTKAAGESLKKMFDKISRGVPSIVWNRRKLQNDNTQWTILNVKNTYIGTDLLQDRRTVLNDFDTEVGINNANTMKRERLLTDEVNSNNIEIQSNIQIFIDTLTHDFDIVNKHYGTSISVKYRYEQQLPDVIPAQGEGEQNANTV